MEVSPSKKELKLPRQKQRKIEFWCQEYSYRFEELNLKTVWYGYFEENEKSQRVQEKCGFKYHHTKKGKE